MNSTFIGKPEVLTRLSHSVSPLLHTLFFSMEGGIAVGIGYLLVRVVKNSTFSRIQILGRYPNTNKFVNADIPAYQTSQEKVAGSS